MSKSRALPRLLGSTADVCTQKIMVAAAAAGVELKLENPGAGQLYPELHTEGGVIRHTNAILRYVGTLYEHTAAFGSSFFESSEVDSWLEWAECELIGAQPPRIKEAIEVLEQRLSDRVYVVGQRYTIADAAISCSIYNYEKQGVTGSLPKATKRWLGTCTAQEAFQKVYKGLPAAAAGGKAAAGAGAAAPAAAAAAPAIDFGLGDVGPDGVPVARYSSCVGGRTRIKQIINAPDGGKSLVGKLVSVCGWCQTKREGGKGAMVFLVLSDGSTPGKLQAVIDKGCPGFDDLGIVSTGASVRITGTLVESKGKEQSVELQVTKDGQGHAVQVFGGVDAKDYPLAKKEHSREYLRSIANLRPRTQFIGAVARIRSALACATHDFFRSRGFVYVHTPLITAADCEGAGEMFQVTTVLSDKGVPMTADKKVDYSKDFFGKPAFLTVSGQLAVEAFACSLSSVYTFGPTFRAENSHTSRHLAEFWMIEPELAFADIFDNMQCAEDYLKHCLQYVLNYHREDLVFLQSINEEGLVARLEAVLKEPFARVSYTEAVDILIKESPKAKFSVPVTWGMDLGSEHERYLVEKVKKKPTIVYNYPKDIKAFYMRLNEDEKTVAAMDVLLPQVGELMGGSQREERLDVLDRRIAEMNLNKEDYWWYRDLRRFGTVPHSGFGLGFERLVMITTGTDNIRDVIPYPRYPGHAEF
mmetsp:Transcript_26452/g.61672  ORF Transcript_26452/g.61672 Transcript_26452/m.61672 type:complete len:699 (+) Transcript_26452:90-2186(+)